MRKKLFIALCIINIHLLASSVSAFQQHSVKKGDTLYRIAKTYGTSVNNLKKANKLRGSIIRPGDIILIQTGFESDNAGNGWENVQLTLHTVKRGESLYRISQQYGTTVNDLKSINNLSGSVIKEGETLFVPQLPNFNELSDVVDVPDNGSHDDLNMPGFSEPESSRVSYTDSGAVLTGYTEEEDGSSILKVASNYLGVPYRFGGETLRGIDCSAFVQRVFKYFSIDLPRTAREQFKAGVKISKGELRIGDLIFFTTYAKYPSHVGIYIGEGKMIHASSRSKKVTITNIDDPYYVRRYIGSVRLPTYTSSISGSVDQTIKSN